MKVIIHLGFPKTASSTMQYGPLMELERQGSHILRTWRKHDNSESLDRRPSSRLFLGKALLPEYLEFSNLRVNVLSDESFTAPVRLRKCNYGDEIQSPYSFPLKIREQIVTAYPNEEIEFIWLCIIRNQSRLIQSQYVEEYNWKRYKNIDLLFDSEGLLDISGYEVYNFSEYLNSITKLAEQFDDRYCFLLYEDMKSSPEYFFGSLDNLFESENGYFEKSFKHSHVNSKVKSRHGTFTKDGEYFVPKMSESIGEEILDYFNVSNSGLIKFFSKENLLKYGYIRA